LEEAANGFSLKAEARGGDKWISAVDDLADQLQMSLGEYDRAAFALPRANVKVATAESRQRRIFASQIGGELSLGLREQVAAEVRWAKVQQVFRRPAATPGHVVTD
jgi:hypothetical protein